MNESKSTYLIDLDGTLLKAQPLLFFFANIVLILKNFLPLLGFGTFKILISTVNQMLKNTSNLTNYELLILGLKKELPLEKVEKALWNFYSQDFPKLAFFCKPVPGAAQALQNLKSKGYRLYLTTNPIWPEECVVKRLQWADVSPLIFEGITHSQNWHSCKPHIQYYREVLQRWNIDPHRCILIGDSHWKDGPASQLGIQVKILPRKFQQDFWHDLST